MYWDLLRFPIRHEKLTWEAREVVREVGDRPRIFVRVKLEGTRFVQRALIPQVWIGRTYAEDVEVADDGLSVRAFFATLPRGGDVRFGYGGHAELSFGKFDRKRAKTLDRSRIARDLRLRLDEPGRPQ